jgi:hypothetical protein
MHFPFKSIMLGINLTLVFALPSAISNVQNRKTVRLRSSSGGVAPLIDVHQIYMPLILPKLFSFLQLIYHRLAS